MVGVKQVETSLLSQAVWNEGTRSVVVGRWRMSWFFWLLRCREEGSGDLDSIETGSEKRQSAA
jgi:hypothetical protein